MIIIVITSYNNSYKMLSKHLKLQLKPSTHSLSSPSYISSSHIGLVRRLAIMRWVSCCIVHFCGSRVLLMHRGKG